MAGLQSGNQSSGGINLQSGNIQNKGYQSEQAIGVTGYQSSGGINLQSGQYQKG